MPIDERRRLPVHCCCHPTTRLGTVLVCKLPLGAAMFPVLREDGSVERVIVTCVARLATVAEQTKAPYVLDESFDPTKPLNRGFRYEDAVKSAHEPIEVWRRVPGFVEDGS